MSIKSIQLRKLIRLFYAKPNLRRELLLRDLREENRRALEGGKTGGDFYAPFWADAKDHIGGMADLAGRTHARIQSNERRKRLYPALTNGFLNIWNEKIRWRNEPFEFRTDTAKGQLSFEELSTTVRVENVLSVQIWDGSNRFVYPYFSEQPALSDEGARLALWVMSEALPQFDASKMRIIDILRSSYISATNVRFVGNEREIIIRKYAIILDEWETLKVEFSS